MGSLARRIQIRILDQQNVRRVPVYRQDRKKLIGFRHRLCAAHEGYLIDGTPILAAQKAKRVRKPRTEAQKAARRTKATAHA